MKHLFQVSTAALFAAGLLTSACTMVHEDHDAGAADTTAKSTQMEHSEKKSESTTKDMDTGAGGHSASSSSTTSEHQVTREVK